MYNWLCFVFYVFYMDLYNKIDFTKIRKILEKNYEANEIIWLVICIFTWVFVIIWFNILSSIWNELSGWDWLYLVLALLFCWWILGAFWYTILHWRKAEKTLLNHINNWTIVVKRPIITEFQYYYDRDSDGHSESWYRVIATDWLMEYKSPKIMNSFFTWEWWITIDKDYYIQRWIPYSLNDSAYLKSLEYARFKKLDQQLEMLKEQYNYLDEKEQKKLMKEIKELEKEKILLLPHHLVSRWATYVIWSEPIITECYIWDEINVFVDPDNPKNYLMEI